MKKKNVKLLSCFLTLIVALGVLAAFPGTSVALTYPTDGSNGRPGLKDIYKDYFLIGVGRSASEINNARSGDFSVIHFNSMTHGNDMKVESIMGSNSDTATPGTGPDASIRNASTLGIKINAHTLVWHNQSGNWPAAISGQPGTSWNYETAKEKLESYMRRVAGKYSSGDLTVYAWDVVNEAMKDNPENPFDWRNGLRTGYSPEERPARWADAYSKGGNSWDYMYDAFVFARRYTGAILNYNDFNDGENEAKATAIVSMVKEFNETYARDPNRRILSDEKGRERKLVEVIGDQLHCDMRLNLGALERTIRLTLAAGVDYDLTEVDIMIPIGLDLGGDSTSGAQISQTERESRYPDQAIFYAKLFMLLKEYAKGPKGQHHDEYGDVGVSRITWWSMTDPGYHYYGYLWGGSGNYTKPAYWAAIQPEEWLASFDMLPGGPASFDYGGKKYGARSWGDPHFAMLDIHVPDDVDSIDFTPDKITVPVGFKFKSISFDADDRSVSVGRPCHATVKLVSDTNTNNVLTYKLTFGKMAVSWYKDTGALENSLAYADVRFSDGVTGFKQYKTYYDRNSGTLKAFDSVEHTVVPKGERATLILKTEVVSDDHNSWGTKNFVLDKDYNPIPATRKEWRLAKRIESGRTYMVMSANTSVDVDGKTYGYVLTNRSKPDVSSGVDVAPESLSRTPFVISGDILIPSGHRDEPNKLANELAPDNVKIIFEEMESKLSGPYKNGYMLECYVHATRAYPQAIVRGNGGTGASSVVTKRGNYYALITRLNNQQSESPQIADSALDRGIWFFDSIDPDTGVTKMFMYTEKGAGSSVGFDNKYYVLKEVSTGTPTANTASGNNISRRQGITGGFVVEQSDKLDGVGTPVKLYVFD